MTDLAQHRFQQPQGWAVQVVCHRGATEVAAENTLPGLHAAFRAGFAYVELDVQETADGALVVIHDPTLERTTNGRGAVCWHTLADLQRLDAGPKTKGVPATVPISTFEDYLTAAKDHGGRLFVELKSADPAKILAAVTAHDMLGHCFFWSFDHAKVQAIRGINPKAAIMARRQDFPSLQALLEFAPQVAEFTLDDDLSEITACREAGISVMTAYMGRDPAKFALITQVKPDLVNLHYPFRFSQLL